MIIRNAQSEIINLLDEYPGKERFPVGKEITAIPLIEMMEELEAIKALR